MKKNLEKRCNFLKIALLRQTKNSQNILGGRKIIIILVNSRKFSSLQLSSLMLTFKITGFGNFSEKLYCTKRWTKKNEIGFNHSEINVNFGGKTQSKTQSPRIQHRHQPLLWIMASSSKISSCIIILNFSNSSQSYTLFLSKYYVLSPIMFYIII